MIWFIKNVARLDSERTATTDLQSRVSWLTGIAWHIGAVQDSEFGLSVDVDIEIDGCCYEVTLRYPSAFPNCPASVTPRNATERWSSHQYGPTGELCLEFGPDNWLPAITGAEMLESTFRLLDLERPLAAEMSPSLPVPTRHALTDGQNFRYKAFRFAATNALDTTLQSLADNSLTKMTVIQYGDANTKVAMVGSIDMPDGSRWQEPSNPYRSLVTHEWSGIIARSKGKAFSTIGEAYASLSSMVASQAECWQEDPEGHKNKFALFWTDGSDPLLLWLLGLPEDKPFVFANLPTCSDLTMRLEPGYGILGERFVGLVGAGSAGSKIATSLARSGAGRFLIIDEDVLLPENIVRHDLDWTFVGLHKVDGLAHRLRQVNSEVKVSVIKIMLTGQEASASVAAALKQLAACDIIIDATADAAVFNVLSAVARDASKTLVWLEVMEGGIGGLVARSRPGVEADPQTMRKRILDWCAERDAPWTKGGAAYGGHQPNGIALIADDAEVTIMSAHATRFVVDKLLERIPSSFPHPAYFVGLRRGWIFNEPFETFPLDVGALPEPLAMNTGIASDRQDENLRFIAALLEPSDEASGSA